jgi:hypothetical protein
MKINMMKRDENEMRATMKEAMKVTMTATMKNTYEEAKKTDANNTSPIKALMNQQASNFFIERDETGELVYHWIDTRVDMLSSSKLWTILGNPERPNSNLDQAFNDAITEELINRHDFFDSRPMPLSH